jgi:hypothetical protein
MGASWLRSSGGGVNTGNLVSLGRHEIYARLLDHGAMHEPFRGRTLPPIRGTVTGRRETVIRASAMRYGRPREEVERTIEQWMGGESGRLSEPETGE